MKKIILSLLMTMTLCLILAGCTASQDGHYKVKNVTGDYHFDEIKGVKEIHYAYEIPQFKSDDVKELNEFLTREAEELSYYYPTDFAEFFIDPESDIFTDFVFEEEYKAYPVCNHKDLVSVMIESYSYTGGAHGMTANYAMNYDVKKQSFIQIADVFNEGFEDELIEMIDYKLTHPMKGEEYGLFPDYKESLDKIFTAGYDTMYFTDDGIGFIYGEYLIAPYASGNIHVEIPYADLYPLLKDDYKVEVE